MSLLQGPVVFIDDQVTDTTASAFQLAQQIRASGRPLREYVELPPAEHEQHWRSIAFLVLDWDLVPGSPGLFGGSTLSEFERANLFEWLERFVDRIFCPVFIVSAEDTDDIERQVGENAVLKAIVDTGRIKVFPKSVLMENFVEYLEEWVSKNPALTALNIWANECEAATDRLFQDMEKLAPDWPAYIWQDAEKDKIDPSFELASVIAANLLNRINVVEFDKPVIREFQGEITGAAMRRVSQGRTALPLEGLYPEMILPGDLLLDEDGSVWVNVTPSCHTVLKRNVTDEGKPDPTKLYVDLIRGQRLDSPPSKSKFDNMIRANPNTMVIHTLLGEDPYVFDFRHRRIVNWNDAGYRIGRLLPPYITLLQQRHASYLMNEGLPRVDWGLYKG